MALPVEYLRCPHCGGGLSLAGAAVLCPAGHSFDVARHGYVDLSGAGRRAAGDSAEMVAAREAFLAAGHFEVVAAAVAAEVCGVGDVGVAAGVDGGGDPAGGGRDAGRTAGAERGRDRAGGGRDAGRTAGIEGDDDADGRPGPPPTAGIEGDDDADGSPGPPPTAGIERGDDRASGGRDSGRTAGIERGHEAGGGLGPPPTAGVADDDDADGGLGEPRTPAIESDGDAGRVAGGGDERGARGWRGVGCVVEVGAGTGYYLSRARGSRAGIALDSSRYAARRAARAGLGAVVCDVWRGLPLRDGVAAGVLCVFAPRNAVEMRRILAPGGVIVVVTPTPRHLGELVEPLGLVRVDERKPERLAAALGEPVRVREIEAELRLSRDDVAALVAMGPSAHHVDAERVARPAVATLSVHVAVYR